MHIKQHLMFTCTCVYLHCICTCQEHTTFPETAASKASTSSIATSAKV